MSFRARAGATVTVLAAGMALASAACVSPDVFLRDGGDQPGGDAGGSGTAGATGTGSGGSNGSAGSNGTGGHVTTGAGGTIVGGSGGRTGTGGTLSGSGGLAVTANLTDDFETGDVNQVWLAPQSSATVSGTKTPCGAWSVVTDSAVAGNHDYQQTSTVCTSSSPTWAAAGRQDWTDMRMQVKVQFPAGATTATIISIGVRYLDPGNVYLLEFSNDGKMKLRSRVGGSSTDVMSDTSKNRVPVPAGQWTTIGISISGSTLNAYLGDNATTPALTGTASGLTHGGVALGVSNDVVSFDDVKVTPP